MMIIKHHLRSFVLTLLAISITIVEVVHARSATTNTYQSVNGLDTLHKDSVTHAAQSTQDPAQLDVGTNTIWKDLSLVFRIYQQCASENLSVCLKVKLLTGLEKAFRTTKSLKVIDGVQFIKANEDVEPATSRTDANKPTLSEKDIEATLPRALNAKEHVLNNLIFKKLAAFLQDHTLQVKFPDIRRSMDEADNDADATAEGRGHKKDKKGGGAYIMIPLLLGGTFIPIAYGALAMLAGKALIVSKLALVLASIIGIKKLLSGGGKESQHEVVVQSGGHSGWGRDFDLAYSGWKPAKDAAKVM